MIQMGPRGMFGAGLGGALLGLQVLLPLLLKLLLLLLLQGGVLAWGAQKLTGVTVAERWQMDYMKIQEEHREKEVKIVQKDMRAQVLLLLTISTQHSCSRLC